MLLRLVVGIGLVAHAVLRLEAGLSMQPAIIDVLATATGLTLLVGFWTPIAGSLLAILELCDAFSQPRDLWPNILLATIGVALALIGPGAFSVDARRFGWKRIDIRDRNT